MGKVVKLTPDERQRIIGLLESGMSVGETARQTGRSKAVVSVLGKRAGITVREQSQTEKARQAAQEYHRERRLALLDRAFQKAEELLPTITTARELRDWAIADGVFTDKRRLETGEATSRHEQAVVHIYVPQSPRLSRPASQVVDVAPAALPEPD